MGVDFGESADYVDEYDEGFGTICDDYIIDTDFDQFE